MERIDILLVEDNPTDVLLMREVLANDRLNINLHVVTNGVEAVSFLRKEGDYSDAPRPDLVFLDLNLPMKDGCQVLAEIKQDKALRLIPVIVLTTSDAEDDIIRAYDLNANCYVTKPVDLETFAAIVQRIKEFWFRVVTLPVDRNHRHSG